MRSLRITRMVAFCFMVFALTLAMEKGTKAMGPDWFSRCSTGPCDLNFCSQGETDCYDDYGSVSTACWESPACGQDVCEFICYNMSN